MRERETEETGRKLESYLRPVRQFEGRHDRRQASADGLSGGRVEVLQSATTSVVQNPTGFVGRQL